MKGEGKNECSGRESREKESTKEREGEEEGNKREKERVR